MTQPPDDDRPAVRPFASVMRDFGRGQVLEDAAQQLQDIVRAVAEHGKKGVLTITVEVAPMKGDRGALLVTAKTNAKAPQADATATVFYADQRGNLLRDHPDQTTIPLRDLAGVRTSEIKDLKHG